MTLVIFPLLAFFNRCLISHPNRAIQLCFEFANHVERLFKSMFEMTFPGMDFVGIARLLAMSRKPD